MLCLWHRCLSGLPLLIPSECHTCAGAVVLTCACVRVADAGGVCRSVEDRRGAVTSSGGLHHCTAELCAGVAVPFCPVWRGASRAREALAVSMHLKKKLLVFSIRLFLLFFTLLFEFRSICCLSFCRSCAELLLSLPQNIPDALWDRFRSSVQVN